MESKRVKLSVPALEEALNAIQGLDNPKLTYATSYWIGRNMKSLREEVKDVVEIRQKMVQDHALMVDGKTVAGDTEGSIKLDPEKANSYWKQLSDFMRQEIEVSVWPISLDLLKDKEGNPIEVRPSTFMALDFMIVEQAAFEACCREFLNKAEEIRKSSN